MPGLAVVAALALEQREIDAALSACPNSSIRIYRSGPGLAAAAAAARDAIADRASVLMSFGLCGALAAELDAGTVIVPRAVLLYSGERYRTQAHQHAWLTGILRDSGAKTHIDLVSVEHAVTSAVDKQRLATISGAAAVDMESAAIAAAAAAAGLPFICVRAIADQLADELPPGIESLVTASGRSRLSALLPYVFRPQALVSLMWLGRRTAVARRSLAKLAHGIVRHDFNREGDASSESESTR
jgi:adenosylhomocysteine nucleosidase